MIRWVLRRGMVKGVLGGSRPWLVAWGIAAGIRVLRRLTRSEPEVVLVEQLAPGEALLITHDTVNRAQERRRVREERRRR